MSEDRRCIHEILADHCEVENANLRAKLQAAEKRAEVLELGRCAMGVERLLLERRLAQRDADIDKMDKFAEMHFDVETLREFKTLALSPAPGTVGEKQVGGAMTGE